MSELTLTMPEPTAEEWAAIVDAPSTPARLRYKGVMTLAAQNKRTVWIAYPDQGPDYGLIDCVLAFGYCEVCGSDDHGMTGADSGVHVCHACQYAAIARGQVVITAPPVD